MARTVDPVHRESVRLSILDAARASVLRDGFENLSLRSVARDADIGPSTVYGYFESREDLLAALASRASERLGRRLGKATDLRALGRAYLRFARTDREDFLLLFSRLESVRKNLEEQGGKSPYDLVRDLAARELPHADPNRVAYALWCQVHGAAMLRLTHLASFDADFESMEDAALDALLRGFAK